MQTRSYSPPLPQAPVPRARPRTNWTATLVAGGVGLLLAIMLIVMLVSRNSELARTRESLRSAQATVSSQASQLDTTRDALSTAEASLSSTRSDLETARFDLDSVNEALDVTMRCAAATLNAWYSTTNDSYETTGYALQAAIDSSACRVVHQGQLGSYGIIPA
jgi:multidrug resistance efflux pump